MLRFYSKILKWFTLLLFDFYFFKASTTTNKKPDANGDKLENLDGNSTEKTHSSINLNQDIESSFTNINTIENEPSYSPKTSKNQQLAENEPGEIVISLSKTLGENCFNPTNEPSSETDKLCTIIDTCSLTNCVDKVERNGEKNTPQKISLSVINNIQDNIDSNISNEILVQMMEIDKQDENISSGIENSKYVQNLESNFSNENTESTVTENEDVRFLQFKF
jgi:hypothetical protein